MFEAWEREKSKGQRRQRTKGEGREPMKAEDTAFLEMEHNVKEYYKNLLIIEGKESLRISYQKRLDKIEEECQRLNHT